MACVLSALKAEGCNGVFSEVNLTDRDSIEIYCRLGFYEITLKEITEETLRSVLELEVSKDQKKFVAPNAVSIAQAHFSKNAWFRAIYANDTPVGFVMLYVMVSPS